MSDDRNDPDPAWMLRMLEDALESWPQFDTGDPVNGGDLVDWFAQWRLYVKWCLDRVGDQPQ